MNSQLWIFPKKTFGKLSSLPHEIGFVFFTLLILPRIIAYKDEFYIALLRNCIKLCVIDYGIFYGIFWNSIFYGKGLLCLRKTEGERFCIPLRTFFSKAFSKCFKGLPLSLRHFMSLTLSSKANLFYIVTK